MPVPRWLVVGNLALSGADVGLTQRCLGAGVCREGNPVMGWASGHPGVFGAVSVGGTAGVSLWVAGQAKAHPKRTVLILAGMAAFKGWVVAHNARVLREGRR